MPQPTHDNIAPLITDLQTTGRTVRVTFRCPVSGQSVSSSHAVPRTSNTSSRLAQTAKRSLMYSLQSTISSAIREVFGYNLVGRVASDVARQAVYSAAQTPSQNTLSSAEQQEAVLAAFAKVSSRFIWDSARGHWISAQAAKTLLSPFEQQLSASPISSGYDRAVLARMLVEVARADGRLAREESSMLTDLIPADLGAISELSARPPLTPAELGEVSASVRQTMLMLAWSLALVDEEFSSAEEQYLQRAAQGMRLTSAQARSARDAAQGYILDQALERMFTWGGHDDYARRELLALAKRIGMSESEAQVAEARYQKRKGLY